MQTPLVDQQAQPMIVRDRNHRRTQLLACQLLLFSCACCVLTHAAGSGEAPQERAPGQRMLQPAGSTNTTTVAAAPLSGPGIAASRAAAPEESAGQSRRASGCETGWWGALARTGCQDNEAEASEAAAELPSRRAMGEALIPHIIHQVWGAPSAALLLWSLLASGYGDGLLISQAGRRRLSGATSNSIQRGC